MRRRWTFIGRSVAAQRIGDVPSLYCIVRPVHRPAQVARFPRPSANASPTRAPLDPQHPSAVRPMPVGAILPGPTASAALAAVLLVG